MAQDFQDVQKILCFKLPWISAKVKCTRSNIQLAALNILADMINILNFITLRKTSLVPATKSKWNKFSLSKKLDFIQMSRETASRTKCQSLV